MNETIPFALPKYVARAGGLRVCTGDDQAELVKKADAIDDPDADVVIWQGNKLVAVLFRKDGATSLLMELDREVMA